jgi:hypothetical protein
VSNRASASRPTTSHQCRPARRTVTAAPPERRIGDSPTGRPTARRPGRRPASPTATPAPSVDGCPVRSASSAKRSIRRHRRRAAGWTRHRRELPVSGRRAPQMICPPRTDLAPPKTGAASGAVPRPQPTGDGRRTVPRHPAGRSPGPRTEIVRRPVGQDLQSVAEESRPRSSATVRSTPRRRRRTPRHRPGSPAESAVCAPRRQPPTSPRRSSPAVPASGTAGFPPSRAVPAVPPRNRPLDPRSRPAVVPAAAFRPPRSPARMPGRCAPAPSGLRRVIPRNCVDRSPSAR